MDHSLSPRATELCDEIVKELSAMDSGVARQHLLQDVITRLDFKIIAISLPEDMDGDHIPAIYRLVTSGVRALCGGVSMLSLVGQPATGHHFDGVEATPCGSRDAPGSDTGAVFREDIVVNPSAASFRAGSIGPFDMHLPTWVNPHMASEIAGCMWRVMRFVLAGHTGSERFQKIAEQALEGTGQEKFAPNYTALGYVRWLLTIGGLSTYDYFGNEVAEDPGLRYSDLFTQPEAMPAEYEAHAELAEKYLSNG